MLKVTDTVLSGVKIIETQVHKDTRGFFMETFNFKEFYQAGIDISFIQDNHSLSVESGIIRGLHYQAEPFAQTKLVRVVAGAIYDVAVDLRPESPTFKQWIGLELSAENHRQLFIPKGFAHGFCTLAPNTEVVYKVDQYYYPSHEDGILWNDPDLSIGWPVTNPLISTKDQKLPYLREAVLSLSAGGIQ